MASLNSKQTFSIDKIYLYSSANATNNETKKSMWNLNVYQFTDIALYISGNANNKGQNTIKELYIDNVKFDSLNVGTPNLHYKNLFEFGKFNLEKDYLITDCRKKELVQFCRNADNEDLIMILQAAIQSNSGLASKLFITLTEGCGYDKICTFASVPARKTDYQAYLRKALKILNDMLLLKNMPADFPVEKYSETDFQK